MTAIIGVPGIQDVGLYRIKGQSQSGTVDQPAEMRAVEYQCGGRSRRDPIRNRRAGDFANDRRREVVRYHHSLAARIRARMRPRFSISPWMSRHTRSPAAPSARSASPFPGASTSVASTGFSNQLPSLTGSTRTAVPLEISTAPRRTNQGPWSRRRDRIPTDRLTPRDALFVPVLDDRPRTGEPFDDRQVQRPRPRSGRRCFGRASEGVAT